MGIRTKKSFRMAMMDRYNKKTDQVTNTVETTNNPSVSEKIGSLVPAKMDNCKIEYNLRQYFLQRYFTEHKLFWSNVTTVQKTELQLMEECIKIEQNICQLADDQLKYRSLFGMKLKKLKKLIQFKKN